MTAAASMSRHTSAWQATTVHPFLAGVRDGRHRGVNCVRYGSAAPILA